MQLIVHRVHLPAKMEGSSIKVAMWETGREVRKSKPAWAGNQVCAARVLHCYCLPRCRGEPTARAPTPVGSPCTSLFYDNQPLERLLSGGVIVSGEDFNYKMIVLTRRLKSPGVLETMSEQVPEVRGAFSDLQDQLQRRLSHLGAEEWTIVSHAQNIYNGILILSVLVTRGQQ